jgi:hypothetical protein
MNFHTVATASQDSVSSSEGDSGDGVRTEYRDLEVINFQRREILFAEYREDGIVWDNSGLKGRTADWAKKTMINNDGDGIITQVRLDQYEGGEEREYRDHLPRCTHLVYAVGYDQSPLPNIIIDNQDRTSELEFDMHTSGFTIPRSQSTEPSKGNGSNSRDGTEDKGPRERVHGLYGTGIAFPEETEDPEGHVEAAVGLAKFFKFAERVKGDWGKVC